MINACIKVNGTTASYPPRGQMEDFSAHLAAISPLLHHRSTLIAIEGHSGTGKSGLAQVLSHNLDNAKCIDTLELKIKRRTRDLHIEFNDADSLYVIDELINCSEDTLHRLADHIKAQGKAIVLMQGREFLAREIDTLFPNIIWMKIDHSGCTLIEKEEHHEH
ncbi:hypothetical protein BTO19_23245 [Vibrio parahaemolyticus]|uniref:hypothetical protein n=1 Tax=Vibrio parahaemolyticus TaxID=670 RepID=UPI000A38C28A|nr:hypothetical protein [Vibrio parahaemolyticus]MDF4269717.1 hypothetical protein [Vibrio parahaemolyticus]MDF4275053.1 hypothetical protein [Vibrio parahaemolyticus]MDF4299645.1 hypothetical protein [Vibrio parahaemolyticus]OUJ23216.1 hypothetical protein BTO19_23245 [Vibrio parahaemolyticus]TOH11008.1 hypothetical protein CGI87_25715 [Vibrio parahaemolyticus]